MRRVARLAAYPIAAILGFLVLSRATVGAWLVTGGFYVADNADYGRPFKSAGSVWWGMRQLNGTWTMASASPRCWSCSRDRARPRASRPACRARAGRLRGAPLYAFFNGHPFRIRYMVVLVMCWRRPAVWVSACCRGGSAGGVARRVIRRSSHAAARDVADGARSAVGRPRSLERARSPRASRAIDAASRFSRAWDRSRTTCRRRRTPASICATTSTKASARSGPTASSIRRARRLGADRGTGRRRRRAGAAAARAPGLSRRLRSGLRRRRRRALPAPLRSVRRPRA